MINVSIIFLKADEHPTEVSFSSAESDVEMCDESTKQTLESVDVGAEMIWESYENNMDNSREQVSTASSS